MGVIYNLLSIINFEKFHLLFIRHFKNSMDSYYNRLNLESPNLPHILDQ